VYILEDLSLPAVTPPEPVLPALVSSDDEPAIDIGYEESLVERQRVWDSNKPYHVPCDVVDSKGAMHVVDCYSDSTAALREIFVLSNSYHESIWVEANREVLFLPATSAIQKYSSTLKENILVSQEIRNMLVWIGLLQLMPRVADYIAQGNALVKRNQELANEVAGDGAEASEGVEAAVEVSAETKHIMNLFPLCDGVANIPKFTAVIGGSITTEKFAAIDNLIDLANTIINCGEMMIPFLGVMYKKQYVFSKHETGNYNEVCLYLLKQSKLRGTLLLLPNDVLIGDEAVKNLDRVYEKYDPEARDEGVEYEGEKTNLALDSTSTTVQKINGHIYDVGSSTCETICDTLKSSNIVLLWGPAGVCESSAFQFGQRCIIESISKKPDNGEGNTENAESNSKYTIVLGDSTCEWFSRVVDGDGEMGGDLVKYGRVSFMDRKSAPFIGILTMQNSNLLSNILLRAPNSDEFVYNDVVVNKDEEEEEEEDDDDE
jgi:hypothetical protein